MAISEKTLQAYSLGLQQRFSDLHTFRIPDSVYLLMNLAAAGKPVSRGLAIQARSALAAWPDEIIVRAGTPYPIALIRELKSEKGRLTPKQKQLQETLKSKGIRIETPRHEDEIVSGILEFRSRN